MDRYSARIRRSVVEDLYIPSWVHVLGLLRDAPDWMVHEMYKSHVRAAMALGTSVPREWNTVFIVDWCRSLGRDSLGDLIEDTPVGHEVRDYALTDEDFLS